jgi:pantoate--beta-alanine ligase
MRVVCTVAAVREAVREARAAGRSVGLVPTMGALHAGHEALIASARRTTDLVVVSCFVNPAQFDDARDLAAYPRSEEADAALADAAGADVFFAPPAAEVYPPGFAAQVRLSGPLVETLEGAHRGAEHFHGVTTVVTKLFTMVGPDVAFFGQKDAQQVMVVRRLVRDLDLPVRIEVVPTVREADGLALSSRNAHLRGPERERAVALRRGLEAAEAAWAAGEVDPARIAAAAREAMGGFGVEPEYLALVDPHTLAPVTAVGGEVLVAVAARVGATRLIDNTFIGTTPQRPRSQTVPHPVQDPTTPEPMGAAR